MGPRVFNGDYWEDVTHNAIRSKDEVPISPNPEDNGSIFVGIPSFRDGKRCAETIRSIFDEAKDPDNVVIGLVEQNDPEDVYCLSAYCDFYGVETIKKTKVREDMIKILKVKGREEKCPRYNQIRVVAIYNTAANGPNGARALTRKILGNEEYCMQIDAHTSFVKDWDEIVKTDWKNARNEFAVISNVPAKKSELSSYNSWTGSTYGEVPRQCHVRIADNDIPEFISPADGYAVGLEKPLLSHTWSSAFSFSKCHLEETVPYDPFTQYVFGAEQFSRYARMWTRGYDVYTPTKNIVFHDYDPNPDGHGIKEWFKMRRERIREQSLLRVKTFLEIGSEEGVNIEVAHANLGVYGLGKRRSIKQLQNFMGINLVKRSGNFANLNCANKVWVPYDTLKIGPMEHLYDKATDLDPQPLFPLRNKFEYYVETDIEPDAINFDPLTPIDDNPPPFMALFIFWIFGLVLWRMVFIKKGVLIKKDNAAKNV